MMVRLKGKAVDVVTVQVHVPVTDYITIKWMQYRRE